MILEYLERINKVSSDLARIKALEDNVEEVKEILRDTWSLANRANELAEYVKQTTHLAKEELIKQAELKKAELIANATVLLTPLQDAVDLDMATDEEVASLKAWKTYRVLLNRVDTSLVPNIVWPEMP